MCQLAPRLQRVRTYTSTLQICCQCGMNFSLSLRMLELKDQGKEAYPKLLHSSLRRLWVVPQFDHGHGHRLVKDDVNTVHLQTQISLFKPLCELACPRNPAAAHRSLTCPGSTGANHMCLPSLVLLTPSISLSGVLTSPLTLSRTLTLSGKAAMSGAHREVEEHTRTTRTIMEAGSEVN